MLINEHGIMHFPISFLSVFDLRLQNSSEPFLRFTAAESDEEKSVMVLHIHCVSLKRSTDVAISLDPHNDANAKSSASDILSFVFSCLDAVV